MSEGHLSAAALPSRQRRSSHRIGEFTAVANSIRRGGALGGFDGRDSKANPRIRGAAVARSPSPSIHFDLHDLLAGTVQAREAFEHRPERRVRVALCAMDLELHGLVARL